MTAFRIVSATDIAEAFHKQVYSVEKRSVQLEGHIKNIRCAFRNRKLEPEVAPHV
jgi:ribosomal protein L9